MFGFSLSKLLVLALVIGAVWYGFKYIGRFDAARKQVKKAARKAAEMAAAAAPAEKVAEPEAQDMERCDTCGDYVASQVAGSCGREACPYPG